MSKMSEAAKHTPGPWTATWTHGSRCAIHCGAWMSQGTVAVVLAAGNDGDFSRETAEATARLIAAAPDLLDALESLITLAKVANVGGTSMYASPAVVKAIAAIAKATK